MTILNESGTPDAVSPLWGLTALAERLPRALIVVVGTRADVHLAQSLSGPLPGTPVPCPSARVVFVMLETSGRPKGGVLASRVVEAASRFEGSGPVLLVAGRSAGLLGLDVGFEANLAERRLKKPVRAAIADARHTGRRDASRFGSLSTDLEDAALGALVELSPRDAKGLEEEPSYSKQGLLGRLPFREFPLRELPFGGRPGRPESGGAGSPVVLLGARPGSQRELAAGLSRSGVEVAGWLPGPEAGLLPTVGEGTVVAAAEPYLTRACRAAEERGATVIRTLAPIGVDGTARFLQDVARAAGREADEASQARQVWEDLESLRNRIRGRRVFFTGDTGLEVPLARFLANAGAVVVEVGTPRLNKKFLAAELAALGDDVDVVESPEWRAQLDRIDATRPDVVVASPGLYNPLVARGHLCRSSLEFSTLDIYGYEGARRVLELFTWTFERATGLDALEL